MRRHSSTILAMLLLAAAAAGCKDQLSVTNVNNPDRDRALNRPTDVENLVAGQFRILNNALWSTGGIQPQLGVSGMESFSTNANFGMGVRSNVPRGLIDNSRGNATDFYATWSAFQQTARAEAVCIARMTQPAFTFFPASEAQRQRDRAFAYFVLGVAQGYSAMTFDSSPVINPNDNLEAPNPLVGYSAVMVAAMSYLDSAVRIASLPASAIPGANGFPLPNTWINGQALTAVQLVALARSYKARFRAGVARTPTEANAVLWDSVIADAAAGITADFTITMTNVSGGWSYNPMQASTFQSWHQEWQFIMGMADTSTGYTTWLNTSRQNKVPFLVLTKDTRFPAGLTRAAQQTASGCLTGATCVPPGSTSPTYNGNFFRNRLAGQDVGVDGLFFSYYDYQRFQTFFDANFNGILPQFTVAELNLLQAEGYIHKSDFVNAALKVSTSRVLRGLPTLAALITTINDPVPGGAVGCIPHVVTGARNTTNDTPTAVTCGNIMEAMKYEKRMETAFINFGGWFFDGRRWGDLPFNTPVQWPVPYTELDSRGQLIYSQPTSVAGAATFTAAERYSNSTTNYGLGTP